ACCYADCAPVFLLDPVRRVVAVAHAGWKGTALKIGLKTVRKMTEQYGTVPSDCLAGIGPSIGPCCYEIDDSVAESFQAGFATETVLTKSSQPGKWFLNIWQANMTALLEAGLRNESITMADLCTACGKEEFFSYRAENEITGRMSSFIMLDQG
ncbi:MAG: polyphenol oxidase family protein, partial [Peptococcaceae bacterium]|nr:polyphenol oxidase family protein [Peptococcaceae bacterium]